MIYTDDYDSFSSNVNDDFPYNVFMYFLDDPLMTGNNGNNIIPLTHSTSLVSVQFAPYINSNELNLVKIPYDIKRFNELRKDVDAEFKIPPYVYKITKLANADYTKPGIIQKRLGTFKCYKPNRSIKGVRNWRNEGKLYQYPYSMAYLWDGIIQPIEVRYHLCLNNTQEVWSRSCININADYSIWLKNYKGDYEGVLEQSMCTTSKELPTTSDQYAQWLSTNKNQMQAQNSQLVNNALMSGVAGAAFSGGNPAVALGSAGLSLTGGMISNTIQQNAMARDMQNLPNALISKGGDFIHGMNTAQKKLWLLRYRMRDEYMQKLGDYFALYGYKQNKMMRINTRNRYYYNYIKTLGVNIEGLRIPKEHLQELKNIYDNGVTVWHVGRDGVTVGDYSKDNFEV